jgi:exodeoxyribonuclease VII small subunit
VTPEPTPDLAFETALDQLDRIVNDLEQGEPDLAAALARYEQAIRLLAHCQSLIEGAEQTVALLTGVDAQGNPLTAPFAATTTPSAASSRKVPPDAANPSGSLDNDDSSIPF